MQTAILNFLCTLMPWIAAQGKQKQKEQMRHKRHFTFMHLPPELRNRIYGLAMHIERPGTLIVSRASPERIDFLWGPVGLLLVSSQVYRETYDMMLWSHWVRIRSSWPDVHYQVYPERLGSLRSMSCHWLPHTHNIYHARGLPNLERLEVRVSETQLMRLAEEFTSGFLKLRVVYLRYRELENRRHYWDSTGVHICRCRRPRWAGGRHFNWDEWVSWRLFTASCTTFRRSSNWLQTVLQDQRRQQSGPTATTVIEVYGLSSESRQR